MGIKIKDTEHVKEIKYEQMIPVGNVDTNDARHVEIGNLSDFVENNIKEKGTFATTTQLNSVQSGLEYLGNTIDQIEVGLNTYETWEFELEDGTTINKKILIQK